MSNLRHTAEFWICFDFRIYQSSEYTSVLNMSGFTRFWIKYFVIDVWQYSEYALDSEYATVLNMLGSHKVVNKIFHHKYLTGFWICLEFWKYQCYPSYMFDRFLSIPWALNLVGLKYTWSWICQGSAWFCIPCILKILTLFWMSWVLNMLRFWMYQESKYAIPNGPEQNTSSYTFDRVLNIPRFQNMPEFWIY